MPKLTQKALNAIRENSTGIKSKLALALHRSEASINRYIRENDDNLTKIAVLDIIRQETGLCIEDILEREIEK